VDSESEQRYFVSGDIEACTCPDFQNRNSICRHINAVNSALGQAEEEIRELESSELMAIRIQQDIRDEIQRNQEGQASDDGFFYCDNLEEFDRNYENILNGNTSTFGGELEFVGGNADAIASELYDLGITAAPYRLNYHARVSDNTKWKLERDGSVSSGSSGGELLSPVLKDTSETWRQIEIICEVEKRHGARVNQSCGRHVHIGMNKLDTARQR
jgi:Putative amidoligase enzyme/SWIM zinc finger